MPPELLRALDHFLRVRGRAQYLALRRLVLSIAAYDPREEATFRRAKHMIVSGKYEEAIDALEPIAPGWFLNPTLHRIYGIASVKLGDLDAAKQSLRLHEVMLEGLLLTGRGNRRRPYTLTQEADAEDVLRHLKKRSNDFAIVEKPGYIAVVKICEDDSRVWFDVTDIVERRQLRMKKT